MRFGLRLFAAPHTNEMAVRQIEVMRHVHYIECASVHVACCGIYRVSQEERTKLGEGVPYVKVYRYNPKHLYPKLNGYGDNGKRSLKL